MIRKGFPAALRSALAAFAVANVLLSGCAGGGRAGSGVRSESDSGLVRAASPAVDTTATVARRDSATLEDFLTDLEQAVRKHDKPALVALLDPDYKAKQLVRIYKGNPDPFLNTLFCGRVLGTDQLYCLDFDAISGFERKSVTRETDWAQPAYVVATAERKIETRLKVMLRKGEPPGLIGSQGFTQIE